MLADKTIQGHSISIFKIELDFFKKIDDFPVKSTLIVFALCLLPTLYYFSLDFSFASSSTNFNIEQLVTWELSQKYLIDEMFYALAGGIQHALLEWSAVILAFLCVIVSMAHYSMSKDISAPVIGLALFLSGCMDMFHTLAATRLIDAVADNSDLIPFTWAISRSFNASVLLIGVLILLFAKRRHINIGMPQIIISGVFLFFIIHLLARWMALSDSLPQTQFPDALITRPFDMLPLIIFIACLPFYWKLLKTSPSYLTSMMFIGLIPDVFSEIYMTFGSDSLFDHHFNSSHGLKILSYALPFLGYLLDYRKMYQDKQQQERELELLNRQLTKQNIQMDRAIEKLSHSNEQLERFAFVCSHDLQEPVRMVSSFGQLLEKRLGDQLDEKNKEYLHYITDGAQRAQSMIVDILSFCRLDQNTNTREIVSMNDVCQQVNSTLHELVKEKHAEFIWEKTLPKLNVVPSQLFQLIMNLVNNGLKFNRSKTPRVSISVIDENKQWRIEISDNGIGIDSKHTEKLFEIFERLNAKSEFPGTGIGLAICKKIVEQHGARITIASEPGEGTTFVLHWPKIEEI